MELFLKPYGFNTLRGDQSSRRLVFLLVILLTLSTGFHIYTLAGGEGAIPMTGFHEFDAMYQTHMREEKPLVDDVMKPVNTIIFNLIEFQMRFVGTLLLFLCITAASFSIWYVARPEFADEVSEVKNRVASGEQIPIEEVKEFFLQFCPDIKANSGIADSYEYEKPTFGLFVRDHLLKFILLFAVAIALQQSVIITFIVKSGNALAFGAKYYTENTDFVGSVQTWTTAGKDYDPGYTTLTTEDRNKRKLYNGMYTALKREFPRRRTEDFLQLIGSRTQAKVTEYASKLNINAENFIVTVNIYGYDIPAEQADTSTASMFRIKASLSEFVNAEYLAVNSNERFMYINVLQYDTEEARISIHNQTIYEDAWGGINNGYPTTVTLKTGTADVMKDGYKFDVPSEVTVTMFINNTTTSHSFNVKPTRSDTDKTLNINYATEVTKINEKLANNKKSDGANGVITAIKISYLGKTTIITNDNTKPTLPGDLWWIK